MEKEQIVLTDEDAVAYRRGLRSIEARVRCEFMRFGMFVGVCIGFFIGLIVKGAIG